MRQTVNALAESHSLVSSSVWLVDVAQQVPAETKLYGFDLSRAQFPRSEWLPSNVKLIAQDALAEVPSEWHGKFDVVNMRFILALVGSEAKYQKLISNIRLLLSKSPCPMIDGLKSRFESPCPACLLFHIAWVIDEHHRYPDCNTLSIFESNTD